MRPIHFLVPAAISLPVIAVVVVALWALGSSGGDRDKFSTLQFVPQDVSFYMAINTDPTSSQWLAVDSVLGSLNAGDPLLDAINEALAEFDLEWEQDILPLAGDEAFLAVTDFEAVGEESGGLLMGFQLRDARRAEEIFLDISEQEGTLLREEEYQGETIYYEEGERGATDITAAGPDDGSVAFVGDVGFIGVSREDVKGAIDVVQGRSTSAEQNQRLQELRRRQDGDFLLWGYTDLEQVWDLVDEATGEQPAGVEFDVGMLATEAREQADRFSFTLSAQQQAFLLDTFVLRSPDADEPPLTTPFDSRLAGAVPQDTLFFAAGHDLYNQLYVPVRDTLAEMNVDAEEDQTFEELLQEFEEEIGVDFEDDLLGLMTGEFAMAFDASELTFDEPEVSVLGMFDVTDPHRVEETMLKLADFLEDKEALTVEESDREGLYRWATPDSAGEAIGWTVTDEDFAIGYPESSVIRFVDGVEASLADSPDWKRTMELLPDDKASIAYLNVSRLLDEVRQIEDTEQRFLEATDGDVTFDDLLRIRSLALAGTVDEDGAATSIVVLVQG